MKKPNYYEGYLDEVMGTLSYALVLITQTPCNKLLKEENKRISI